VLAAAVASREQKPRVFVSASAIGYYGSRGDELLSEASGSGSDFLAELCVAWEAETEPARAAGVRTVLPRTGIVLSRDGGALARMLTPFKLGLGGKQGSGKQWMSWVTIDDHIAALRFALENDAVEGALNVVAPNPVTNADFASTLGRVLHRPTVLPTPLFVLKAQYGAELVETLLLFSQRVASARLESLGFRFTYPVLHPALEHVVGR
jgi:uncharacterized protein (TIGR01777 family)